MTLDDLCIKTPPLPNERHQSYNIGVRAYFIERDSGDITLHPVHNFVADKHTSEMIHIDVFTIGDRTPGQP